VGLFLVIIIIILSHFLPHKRWEVAWVLLFCVATPLLKECEDDTHTPEMGTWESSEISTISQFICRGHNTSH
jgi:hypothetical protein